MDTPLELPPEDDAASEAWTVSSWLSGAKVHRVVAAALQAPVAGQGLTNAAALSFVKGLRSRDEVARLLDTRSFMRSLVISCGRRRRSCSATAP